MQSSAVKCRKVSNLRQKLEVETSDRSHLSGELSESSALKKIPVDSKVDLKV